MNLVPAIVLSSVLDITPEWMDARGLRGLLVDLDNTLAPYRSNIPGAGVRKWLISMRDYDLMVFSNARATRVTAFCEPLGLQYIAKARKPRSEAAKTACERLGLKPGQTAIVGDQIFTDVLCANRAGMLSVIVEPLKKGFLINFRRNIIEGRHIGQGGSYE